MLATSCSPGCRAGSRAADRDRRFESAVPAPPPWASRAARGRGRYAATLGQKPKPKKYTACSDRFSFFVFGYLFSRGVTHSADTQVTRQTDAELTVGVHGTSRRGDTTSRSADGSGLSSGPSPVARRARRRPRLAVHARPACCPARLPRGSVRLDPDSRRGAHSRDFDARPAVVARAGDRGGAGGGGERYPIDLAHVQFVAWFGLSYM